MKKTGIITYLFLFLAMSQFVIAGEGNPVLNGVTATPFYSGNYTINIHLTANDTINVNNGIVLIYDTNNSLLDSVKTVNGHATAQFSMTSIDNGRTGVLPDRYEIKAGPNPFNPHTTIRFSVPFRGNYRVDVYDILGRHVKQLKLEDGGKLEAGTYSVLFDGKNKFGQKISSGFYIYILKDMTRGKIYSGKMSMPKGYKSEFKSALLQSKRTNIQTCDLDSPEMREFIVKAMNDPTTDPKINETVMSMFAAGDTSWNVNAGKNHKPLIEENYITPSQPLTTDTLFANFYITDEDSDEITPEVKWLVNGNPIHIGERLTPENYNADDVVKTIVSAYDGKETAVDTSDAVVVLPNERNVNIGIYLTANDTINVNNGLVFVYDTENNFLDSTKTNIEGRGMVNITMIGTNGGGNIILPTTYIVKALNDPTTDPKINETIMNMLAAGDTTWHINAGKNHKPLIEENYITPSQPLTTDTLFANFYITDEDGDEVTPEVKWLVNNNLVHAGEILVPGNYNKNDSVRTIISAYDGKETARDTSDAVIVLPNERNLSVKVIDYFKSFANNRQHVPVEGMLVKSLIDSGYTNAEGLVNLKAIASDTSHLIVYSPNHLLDGIILKPGLADTSILKAVANKDTSDLGIDEWYFENYFLKKAGTDYQKGIYLAMTRESVPDTAFIGGYVKRDDGLIVSYGWFNVEQLNACAQVVNEEGAEITTVWDPVKDTLYTLIGENETLIAIADTNFAHPDSTAKFAYSNMIVVPNELLPALVYGERMKKSIEIRPMMTGTGFNGTFYAEDGITVIGSDMSVNKFLTPSGIGVILSNEFYPSISRQMESSIGYPSLLDTAWPGESGDPEPHDARMMIWSIFKGPGCRFPALPKGFDMQLAQQYMNQ